MIVVIVVVVTGGKQSQLLALALGLGWSLTKIYSPFYQFLNLMASLMMLLRKMMIFFGSGLQQLWAPYIQHKAQRGCFLDTNN